MSSRAFMSFLGAVLVVLALGCSSQAVTPTNPSQSPGTTSGMHPECNGCHGNGTSGGGDGGNATATPSPAPTTIGRIVVTASQGIGCDAKFQYCDGTDFTQCVICSGRVPVDPSGDIALLSPHKGEDCFGSQGKLGNQLPANTKDQAHEITNIQAVWAPTNGGTVDVAGWIYSTGPGGSTDHWFQLNPGYANFWNAVANNIPGFSNLANFITSQQSGYTSLTDPVASALLDAVKGQSGYAASCFSSPLL